MVTTLTRPTLMQQTECISSKAALEVALAQFIHSTLRATTSSECSSDTAIALLDRAWAAQKLLWSLRD